MTTEAKNIVPVNCDDMSGGSNTVDFRKNKEKDTLTQQNAPIKFSSAEEGTQKTLASTDLKKMVMDAADVNSPAVQLAAVQQCRQLLSCDKNTSIHDIIATGILPSLIQCLSRADNPSLQYESSCVLEIITLDTSTQEEIQEVVDAGIVSVLVELLKSPSDNIYKQALRILYNIISVGCVQGDFVISQGLMKPLLSIIKPDADVSVLRKVTLVIQELYKSGQELPPKEVIQDILHLYTLIMNEDTDILLDILWVVNFLTSKRNYHIQVLIDVGIVPKLVLLLSHKEIKVQTNALSAICNIVSGTEAQTQVVLNCGVFLQMPALLSHREGSSSFSKSIDSRRKII